MSTCCVIEDQYIAADIQEIACGLGYFPDDLKRVGEIESVDARCGARTPACRVPTRGDAVTVVSELAKRNQ